MLISSSSFDKCIETDGVLFFLRIMPVSANRRHFFGLASDKIDMRGDFMETQCHLEIAMLFSRPHLFTLFLAMLPLLHNHSPEVAQADPVDVHNALRGNR